MAVSCAAWVLIQIIPAEGIAVLSGAAPVAILTEIGRIS